MGIALILDETMREQKIQDKECIMTQQDKFDEMENVEQSEMVFANMKRTYDAYQDLDLTHARTVNQLTAQALQNAIETANMVSKQAVKHADIACDRQWNVDEQGYTVADILNDSKFQDALAVLLVEAVKGANAE